MSLLKFLFIITFVLFDFKCVPKQELENERKPYLDGKKNSKAVIVNK